MIGRSLLSALDTMPRHHIIRSNLCSTFYPSSSCFYRYRILHLIATRWHNAVSWKGLFASHLMLVLQYAYYGRRPWKDRHVVLGPVQLGVPALAVTTERVIDSCPHQSSQNILIGPRTRHGKQLLLPSQWCGLIQSK